MVGPDGQEVEATVYATWAPHGGTKFKDVPSKEFSGETNYFREYCRGWANHPSSGRVDLTRDRYRARPLGEGEFGKQPL